MTGETFFDWLKTEGFDFNEDEIRNKAGANALKEDALEIARNRNPKGRRLTGAEKLLGIMVDDIVNDTGKTPYSGIVLKNRNKVIKELQEAETLQDIERIDIAGYDDDRGIFGGFSIAGLKGRRLNIFKRQEDFTSRFFEQATAEDLKRGGLTRISSVIGRYEIQGKDEGRVEGRLRDLGIKVEGNRLVYPEA